MSRRTSRHVISRENPRARQLAMSIRAPQRSVNNRSVLLRQLHFSLSLSLSLSHAKRTSLSAVHRVVFFAPFFAAFPKAFFPIAFAALLAASAAAIFTSG